MVLRPALEGLDPCRVEVEGTKGGPGPGMHGARPGNQEGTSGAGLAWGMQLPRLSGHEGL